MIKQVVDALGPQARLDYPTLSNIYDAAAWDPSHAQLAMHVLVATLTTGPSRHGDMRSPTQDYYKVLTILNEVMYEADVRDILQKTPGLRDALERLKRFSNGGMGKVVDENIRMLANEVSKGVFRCNPYTNEPVMEESIDSADFQLDVSGPFPVRAG